jgi:transcriptional regulator with XRE-family HTH domain
MTLARNLNAVMSAKKRSARDVATEAGLSNATVSNLLRGKHKASIVTAEEVSQALGFDLWQLLCPALPRDQPDLDRLAALLANYVAADPRGQELIDRTAELAAKNSAAKTI